MDAKAETLKIFKAYLHEPASGDSRVIWGELLIGNRQFDERSKGHFLDQMNGKSSHANGLWPKPFYASTGSAGTRKCKIAMPTPFLLSSSKGEQGLGERP
jgi:hypothetical protein